MGASILDLIATHNPTAFEQGNRQREANIGSTLANTQLTQAQVPLEQARVPLVQAQVPLVQAQATGAQQENQIRARRLKDMASLQDVFSKVDPTLPPDQRLAAIQQQLPQSGITGEGQMEALKQLTGVQESYQKMTEAKKKNEQTAVQQVGNLIQGADALPEGPQREAYWNNVVRPGAAHFGEQLPVYSPEAYSTARASHGIVKLGIDLAHTQAQTRQAEADAAAKELENKGQKPLQPADLARIQHEQETAAELHRHNVSEEAISRVNAAVNQGKLAQEVMVNGMKYGPGTSEYWVQQLHDNPDSIKEMPPELRSTVGKAFTAKTGLPLPTPLSGATQTQETAARNALDGVKFIQQAMQNPEIRANLGPILGRLQNAEQRVGAAVGLSPQAEQLAQELRTRMRYFVFQEGKAILGGRLPQQLMKELESSSARVSMEPDMLQGAINGAKSNAEDILVNADKQRFGGKARSKEKLTGSDALPQGSGKVIDRATARQFYDAAGRDPAKAQSLAEQNGWKVQ